MAEVMANGLRTHVQRLGAGTPTVVCVHGIVVDNLSSLYFLLATQIANETSVLLYDQRGHGKTERPPSGYGLDELHADLHAILDHEQIAKPILLGHSYGGLLSLTYAARHPEQVAGLILIDPPLPLGDWGSKIASIFSITGEERDRRIREAYDTMHGSRLTRKRRRLAETADALVDQTTLLDDMRAAPAFTEQQLKRIQCPTLAIYGDGSELVANASLIESLWPQATVEIFSGCSHQVLFEATPQVQSRILAWLQRYR